MNDPNFAPVCGLYCGDCEHLGKNCEGCGHVDGKPFWAAQLPSGTCPFHDCCRNQKKLEHCGLCDKCPCQLVFELRDPNWSDEFFQDSLQQRQAALKRRTEIGTAAWLREVSEK
jgi:hypothetical protein